MREEEAVEGAGGGEAADADQHRQAVRLQHFAETGCFDASAFIRANSGDSSMARRIRKLSRPARPPSTKAMRQPYTGTSSGGSQVRTPRLTPVATATPIVTQANTTPADERRVLRRGLDHVGQGAWQFAADAESLDQPQGHHREAGPDAPGRE